MFECQVLSGRISVTVGTHSGTLVKLIALRGGWGGQKRPQEGSQHLFSCFPPLGPFWDILEPSRSFPRRCWRLPECPRRALRGLQENTQKRHRAHTRLNSSSSSSSSHPRPNGVHVRERARHDGESGAARRSGEARARARRGPRARDLAPSPTRRATLDVARSDARRSTARRAARRAAARPARNGAQAGPRVRRLVGRGPP